MAKAKQKDLPGMEDRKLKDLDDAATEYAEIRDKRQDLSRREVELKNDLLGLMKKHKKREYTSDGIEIRIVVEQETVKVKINKASEEDVEEEQSEAAGS